MCTWMGQAPWVPTCQRSLLRASSGLRWLLSGEMVPKVIMPAHQLWGFLRKAMSFQRGARRLSGSEAVSLEVDVIYISLYIYMFVAHVNT